MLEEIKARLQITGTHMDGMLEAWIDSAKAYLINGGADSTAVETAYGVIAKGVFDMWTSDEFSPMFLNMVTQFCLSHPNEDVELDDGYTTATEPDIDSLF